MTQLDEVAQLRQALASALHSNHVLTQAIRSTIEGRTTVEQLRAWWVGPLVSEKDKA